MNEFYVLWILLGVGNTQTLAVDHFATMQECEAAKAGFIADYNSTKTLSILMLDGSEARCFKAEVKR